MYSAIVFLLCLVVILAFKLYEKSVSFKNESDSYERESRSRQLTFDLVSSQLHETRDELSAVRHTLGKMQEDAEKQDKMLIDIEERYKARIVEVEDVLMKENPTVTVRKEVREVSLTMPPAVQMAVVMYLKMAVSGARLRFDDMKSAMEIIAKLESDLKEIKEGDELKLS